LLGGEEKDDVLPSPSTQPDDQKLMLCIPGPWQDRTDFVRSVVTRTGGDFMFAGAILANPKLKDHVPLEFCDRYPEMRQAFEIAGQGKLSSELLDQIDSHRSVLYVRFPLDAIAQRARLLTFTSLLHELGGFAVKVESTGVAHSWDMWNALVSSDNLFDQYRCFVILLADDAQFYSCGMHHFGLPDCEISRACSMDEAADTMNRFNYYQIAEQPDLRSGHTFSLTPGAPCFQLALETDSRHGADDLFRNPNGVWTLKQAEPSDGAESR
jgi:hypothetical protein